MPAPGEPDRDLNEAIRIAFRPPVPRSESQRTDYLIAGPVCASAAGLAPVWADGPSATAVEGCCISMLPRKCAPSPIATRGAVMSPSTEPFSWMLTVSVAVMSPVTVPATINRMTELGRPESFAIGR